MNDAPVPMTPEALADLLTSGVALTVLDVRSRSEYDEGHLPGAQCVPVPCLDTLALDRQSTIVVYCTSQTRSAAAAAILHDRGYRSVCQMTPGFVRWKALGLPVVDDRPTQPLLSDAERERYRRHLRLPEVGEEGQRRLAGARVLVVGAGGLGSPVALYLAAAGVGTLAIVDDDSVCVSNLQRQLLHRTDRIGMRKVDSAQRTLEGINPHITVRCFAERLDASNAEALLAPAEGHAWDVVVDGSDNLSTRYVLNDACVRHKLPLVHGSIHRFSGQVTVFAPPLGPCYRCLYRQAPPAELAPSCAEVGVLGALCGVIGSLQATEVLKLLLGRGQALVGRLLVYEGLAGRFFEVAVPSDPQCPTCSPHAMPRAS